jgi:hypothetical protein
MAKAIEEKVVNTKIDPAFSGDAIERMRQKPAYAPVVFPVQPKLSIGQPGDKYEQEADRMSSVVISPDSHLNRSTSPGIRTRRDPSLPTVVRSRNGSSLNKDVVRNITPLGEQLRQRMRDNLVQRPSGHFQTQTNLENQLQNTQGGGNPLSEEVRTYMEPRFGVDFSEVRVHTGEQAVQMNQDLDTQAFTYGRNVYYGAGKAPGVDELTAHELTHIVQQTGGVHLNNNHSNIYSSTSAENQSDVADLPAIQMQPRKNAAKSHQPQSAKVQEENFYFSVPVNREMGHEESLIYVLKHIFGISDQVADDWIKKQGWYFENAKASITQQNVNQGFVRVSVPKKAYYQVVDIDEGDGAEKRGENNRRAGASGRDREFQQLSAQEQAKINAATDKILSQSTVPEKVSAELRMEIRDKFLLDRDKLLALPPEMKGLLGTHEAFQPKDYQQLIRIAAKLKQFTPEDFAVYKLLTIKATDKIDLFEKSVDTYLARKKQLEVALAEQQKESPTKPTLQDTINQKWNGLDESVMTNMSEDQRYQVARQKTNELTAAQLKFMEEHPGETLADFAKSATLFNTSETFKGTAKDIIEASSGDANKWARWAAGAGAGAKISGWLLAVGGIVYLASWLTGVGELATVAAGASLMLGTSLTLSLAESELRIKAASVSKTPEDFKRNVELAAAARTNVTVGVSMLVVAAALHFTAQAKFPQTLEKIDTSLKNFRERIRLKGSVYKLKHEITKEMNLGKGELVKLTHLAKKQALDTAKDLAELSTEQFVDKLERGDSGFLNQSKLAPGQKINYRELLKTPEGRSAIEGYKQRLINALTIDVVAEIDKLAHQYTAKIDKFLQDINSVKNHDQMQAVISKTDVAFTREHLKTFMQETQQNITQEKLKEAATEAHEEIITKTDNGTKNNNQNEYNSHPPDKSPPIESNNLHNEHGEPNIEDIFKNELGYDWNNAKKYIDKPGGKEKMRELIKYRQQKYSALVREIQNKFKVEYKLVFREVAPGSSDLTSDIDATFISETGDTEAEVRAVEEFNRRFREEFGKESGNVFDLNVYTTGHMPKAAFGDEAQQLMGFIKIQKLKGLKNELRDANDSLKNLTAKDTPNKREFFENKIEQLKEDIKGSAQKIKDLVSVINELRSKNQQSNIDEDPGQDIVNREINALQAKLKGKVSQELSLEGINENTKADISATDDIMALLKQRRNISNDEWKEYQQDFLQDETDPNLREATRKRLNKTDEIYKQAQKEAEEMIVSLNKRPGKDRVLDQHLKPVEDPEEIQRKNADAELEAYNRLNEYYLRKSQAIREKLNKQEGDKSQLMLELDEAQSKALFFANEAYQTRAAAMQVVLGQQMRLELPSSAQESLVSINEQIGFALEQISEKKGIGTSLWKSAKYLDRLVTAVDKIKNTCECFSEPTLKEVEEIRETSKILLDIKKGEKDFYKLNSQEQSIAAEEIGKKGYPFSMETIADFRRSLLEFSSKINLEVRKAMPDKFNTSPPPLEQKLDIENINSSLHKFYSLTDEKADGEMSNVPESGVSKVASNRLDSDIEMVS